MLCCCYRYISLFICRWMPYTYICVLRTPSILTLKYNENVFMKNWIYFQNNYTFVPLQDISHAYIYIYVYVYVHLLWVIRMKGHYNYRYLPHTILIHPIHKSVKNYHFHDAWLVFIIHVRYKNSVSTIMPITWRTYTRRLTKLRLVVFSERISVAVKTFFRRHVSLVSFNES